MKPHIPGYTLGRRLGVGAFGKVYQAIDASSGKYVAVKVLISRIPSHLQLLVREAHNLHRQLSNAHVVDFVGCNLDCKQPFIIMEYCNAGTLDAWVEESSPGWRDVAAALLHAADGLAAIHEAGGFHRDIKPQNLLLTDGSNGKLIVKLGDFGLARIPSSMGSALTQSPWGSPAYMAPEVLEAYRSDGAQVYTAGADIYSLGITGIELLSGQRDRLMSFGKIPSALSKLLLHMTEPNVLQRPTALEVGDLLDDILTPEPVSAPAQRKQGGELWPWLLGGAVLGAMALVVTNQDDD